MPRTKHISLDKIQKTALERTGKRLTTKQTIFIQEKLKGKSGTQAALAAYNQQPNTARVQAQENMLKPAIVDTFNALMDSKGLTDDYLIEKTIDSIEQSSVEGKRIEYLSLALKLKGKLQNVNVNLSKSIKETRSNYSLD